MEYRTTEKSSKEDVMYYGSPYVYDLVLWMQDRIQVKFPLPQEPPYPGLNLETVADYERHQAVERERQRKEQEERNEKHVILKNRAWIKETTCMVTDRYCLCVVTDSGDDNEISISLSYLTKVAQERGFLS